jgi:polyhydroxyalkanoic acid synthase PhaR subunit
MTSEQKDPGAPSDPFALWKQWYEQNEEAWGKRVAEATGTTAFAEAQGKMLESFLAFQKTLRDASRTQLEALGLPTRDDVARLGEIVLGLEEKIDRIADRIGALEPAPRRPAAKRTPPRKAKRRA